VLGQLHFARTIRTETQFRRFIRPLPFLAYFAQRSVLYVGVIVFVIAVVNEALSMRRRGLALRESGPSTSSLRWCWRLA
jgi:hypothetical protein